MQVTVRLFAVLRDRAGASQVTLDLSQSPSVDDVKRAVAQRYPQLEDLLSKTAVAVNRAYEVPETQIHEGDEIALIPPVSGG
jgi:MoaE-MoaD fusion protein